MNWLTIQEHRHSHSIFLVEWLSMFALAWFFWSILFFGAPGSISPGIAATLVAILYATCVVYGRLLKATGCRKCASPWPFMRTEAGRRHLPDQEHCIEVEYGGEEFGQHLIQVYCKIVRADMVTFSCKHCEQMWEEKLELPGTGYRLVRRIDITKDD